MSTGLLVPRSADLRTEVQVWSSRADGLVIRDRAGCEQASLLLRSIKGVRGDIQRQYEPHIERAKAAKAAADAARKALVDELDATERPLVQAEAVVKSSLLAWEREEETRRRTEEARLQAEAQKEAEAQTLAAAAALERDGHALGDAEMVAEAEALLDQPIEAPTVYVKRDVPKVQGIMYRDNWAVHPEIDVRALAAAVAAGIAPATFLQPNLTAIRQWARATQGGAEMPGVRVFNDRQIAARG